MTARMRFAFVTHGGAGIGLGHVRRCLALARGLSAQGADVAFVLGADKAVARLAEQAGFSVTQAAWEDDATAAARAVQEVGADTVVVDSYVATLALFETLRAVTGQVVAVDDLAERPLPVDVVVNGGVGAESLPYGPADGRLLLLGPQYALIDAGYAEAPPRQVHNQIGRVLVTLGGSVHPGALQVAVAAVAATLQGAVVDVVAGPYAEAATGLDEIVRGMGDRIVLRRHVLDLRPLMLAADVAITGAGMTLYELAATATPIVSLTMAPNQRPHAAAFERAGAALAAGSADHPDLGATVARHLGCLAADATLRENLGAAGRRLVDGQGASRVARELASMPSPRR